MSTFETNKESGGKARRYTRRSEAQWRELIANYDQSHLTLEAYCQQHQIAPSGFYTWRKRLKRNETQDNNIDRLIDITPQLSMPTTTSELGTDGWQVELEFGQGWLLRIKAP